MFFSYKLVLFLSSIIIFEYFEINANQVFYLERNNVDLIKNNLPPSRKDLLDYVKSLEEISKFAFKHKQYLDINFGFGLFVVNVNLRPYINHPSVTVSLRERLWNILKINDKLIENFGNIQTNDKNDQLLWRHMTNETAWTKRLKKFNYDLVTDGKRSKMLGEEESQDPPYKVVYPNWDQYLNSVYNYDANIPDPQLSDYCLLMLSENEENPSDQYQRCNFSDKCNDMLLNGNNFGYSLSHRLLYLTVARISRGCYIYSPQRDQKLRNDLCKMMYEESKYLASNGFKLIDLLLEDVGLCSLEGHAEFLRHSWLSELLTRPKLRVCFNQQLDGEDPYQASELNRECHTHVIAVAASALAGAVRFILEKY